MTLALWLAIAALAAAQLAAFIITKRNRTMDLKESLAAHLEFRRGTVAEVNTAIAALPPLIRESVLTAIAKYRDDNPAPAGGSVSDEELVAFLQNSTDLDKELRGLAPHIQLLFDHQNQFGDPEADRPVEPVEG